MPFGFRPYRHMSGGTLRVTEYNINPAYSTKIHTGAPVKIVAGYVQLAAAGDTILGIANGVSYTNAAGEQKWSRYWTGEASATNIKISVFDDPDMLFAVEDDGVSDYLTIADVGSTGNHIAGTASDVTGISGAMLDTSDVGTGTGFRIVDLVPRVGNAFGTGAGQRCEVAVLINLHQYSR